MPERTMRLTAAGPRGQLSLEFLLLFAIFIAALAVLVSMSLNTKGMAQSSLGGVVAQKALSELSTAADNVCVLGEGNIRNVQVSLVDNSTLSASGNSLSITTASDTFNKSTKCSLVPATIQIKSGVVRVEKRGASILLTSS